MNKSTKLGLIFVAMSIGAIAGCRDAEGDPTIKSNPEIVFTNQSAIEAVEFTNVPYVSTFVRIRDKETGVVCYGASVARLSCTADLSQDPSVEEAGWNTVPHDEIQWANSNQTQK